MNFNKYFNAKNTQNIIENPHLPSIPGLNKYYLNSDNIFYKEKNIVINFDDISNGFKKGKFFSYENIYEENIFHSEIYFDYNFKDEELNISPKINNPFSIKAFEINNFLFEKNTKREFSFYNDKPFFLSLGIYKNYFDDYNISSNLENEINTKIEFSKKNFYIPTELKEIEIISELKWNSIPYNLFFLSEETENFFSKSNKSEKEKINNSNDCIILYNKLENDFSTKNLNSFSLDNKENISEGLKDDSFCLIMDYSNLEDKENINDKKIPLNIESNLNKNIFEINIIEDYIINYIKNEVNISSSLNLNNKEDEELNNYIMIDEYSIKEDEWLLVN